MAKQHDKQFKLDGSNRFKIRDYKQAYRSIFNIWKLFTTRNEFTVVATLCHQMNSSEYIEKERPFSLEVFRHMGHNGHLLFAADLLPKRRNAQNRFPLFVTSG